MSKNKYNKKWWNGWSYNGKKSHWYLFHQKVSNSISVDTCSNLSINCNHAKIVHEKWKLNRHQTCKEHEASLLQPEMTALLFNMRKKRKRFELRSTYKGWNQCPLIKQLLKELKKWSKKSCQMRSWWNRRKNKKKFEMPEIDLFPWRIIFQLRIPAKLSLTEINWEINI